ncbi:MAG: hypothetical protein H5U20_00575 [Rhodobacteraceae bacterium]|nr:hypothetical protein [Paracoccaceae bacterium]
MRLIKRLATTAAAAAIALGAAGTAATPARAGGDDVAAALAGIAALAIIGSALSDDRGRAHAGTGRSRVEPLHGFPRDYRRDDDRRGDDFRRDDGYGRGHDIGRGRGHDIGRGRGHRTERLPEHCVDTLRIRGGGHARFYGARCLDRAGFDRLPRGCAVDVGNGRGGRTAYSERCLIANGYAGRGRDYR